MSYDPFKKSFNIASTTDEHLFLFELSLSQLFYHVLLLFVFQTHRNAQIHQLFSRFIGYGHMTCM